MLNKVNIKTTALALCAFAAVSFSSCKKDQNAGPDSFDNRSTSADYGASITSRPVVTVSGDITTAVNWSAANIYEISGVVTVRSGGSLTIPAGTYIKSTVNPTGTNPPANGVLVIAKDGEIHANGTASNPIVFTSRYELDGIAGQAPAPGDFGGVIILGDAPINETGGTDQIEGLPALPQFSYGGADAADNRGNFNFVRIEYAGFKLDTDIEVNGLTLGGVGTGTSVSNVEVAWGLDDGFEFFGGTVNASGLLAFSVDDDGLDFDQGYTGTISNSYVILNTASTHSGSGGVSDSNGSEIDNNATNFAATPRTNPTFNNVRIIGSRATSTAFENGIHVRRGAALTLTGSRVTGFNIGLRVEANAGTEVATATNSFIHGFTSTTTGNFVNVSGNTLNVAATASNYGMTQPFFNTPGFNPNFAPAWVRYVYPVI
ncbi:autotransporter outer membrane beta-barrel domain-containing protein [Pedobacter kyonggii]|uniref:T9SS C-terminal target domain-containing protein n=1 Tax=Pedobacter kyonggii TaxID=1926871 RepID=A0A4Q9HI86_9SPHI|nr:hypothetical protein [Pedobacter kyonggii]TBO44400.1 hypothetical protein EYS08_03565 [Pedobacter kyonggii]